MRRRLAQSEHHDELTKLARRVAEGDSMAAEDFVAASAVDVWRLCAHLVDPDAADDLTQITYERALPALARFRGESSARTWLLTIARRVCADEIRGRVRQRRLQSDLQTRARSACSTANPQDHHDLVESVRSISAERREAFVLTQVIGLHYDEAAAVLGCPVGTVRSRVARARDELRANLTTTSEQGARTGEPQQVAGTGRD